MRRLTYGSLFLAVSFFFVACAGGVRNVKTDPGEGGEVALKKNTDKMHEKAVSLMVKNCGAKTYKVTTEGEGDKKEWRISYKCVAAAPAPAPATKEAPKTR